MARSGYSKIIKHKHKAWNTYKATRRCEDYISYTKCRNKVTAAVKYAKSTFETNLARNIQHNPNLFWKYVRSNTKVRDDVDKLVKRDGTLTCSDRDVANCLNDFLIVFISTKLYLIYQTCLID